MRFPSFLILSLLVAACGASAPVREYLDDETAATVTVASGGWIFARERPDLAVHAQDYITITPVQINRSGERRIYLYCQLWSTIDHRGSKAIVPSNAQLALLADDRRIALPQTATDIRKLGLGHSPVPIPNRAVEVRAAAVDAELLRFIDHAVERRISVSIDGVSEYFTLWRGDAHAPAQFLERIEVSSR